MALERDTQTQTQTEAQKALAGGSSGATTTSATAASMRHTLMLHNAMARLQIKSPLNFRADNLALMHCYWVGAKGSRASFNSFRS